MYDRLIVISDFLNTFYSDIFPKNQIFQIPILVDMNRFPKNPKKIKNEIKIITYIGYMIGNKDGIENLIDAMVIVKEKINNTQLQLIGIGPEEILTNLKKK